ncbi:hypothetical protein Avbf_16351, partial [Armadillidium vulgare]
MEKETQTISDLKAGQFRAPYYCLITPSINSVLQRQRDYTLWYYKNNYQNIISVKYYLNIIKLVPFFGMSYITLFSQ